VVGDVVSVLPDKHVDLVCNVPNMGEWSELLVEDYRLMGHNVVVRLREHQLCQGREGLYGDEACGRGVRGGQSITGSSFELLFPPLWGRDCMHSTRLAEPSLRTHEPDPLDFAAAKTPGTSRHMEAWLSHLVEAVQHRVWPTRSRPS
jgi:hypothetical protein